MKNPIAEPLIIQNLSTKIAASTCWNSRVIYSLVFKFTACLKFQEMIKKGTNKKDKVNQFPVYLFNPCGGGTSPAQL